MGRGAVGFDLAEFDWGETERARARAKDFVLRATALAASGHRWSELGYHPPRVHDYLHRFTTMEHKAEDAARSLAGLVGELQNRGIEHPGEACHIYGYLTRLAADMRTALDSIGTSVQLLQDEGRLMSDFRGEPLDEVLERFTEHSAAAQDLAGGLANKLSKTHSAVGDLAYAGDAR
ncbi:hypothetical protein [Streptomyces sp. NPDC050704]|uniref:hypothetical protein n=1 Tax=Streptomyces sp. NPDC050704 TaxID=3157219 RepID=UPI0034445918